jgi:hypothetical protein
MPVRCIPFLLAAVAWAGSAWSGSDGREWEFTGHLVNHVSPGPPDYESVLSGDEPVTRWYLQLPWPACVSGHGCLTRLQLSLTPQEVERYRRFLGKEVTVSGKLEEGRPGRDTTSLVMNVSSLVGRARGSNRVPAHEHESAQ